MYFDDKISKSSFDDASHLQDPEGVINMSAIPWESMKRDGLNLPNRLSLLRALASWVPALLIFLAGTGNLWLNATALLTVGVLMITDFLDGRIARKRGLITEWGKFIDPLGDKLLVAFTLGALMWVYQDDPLALALAVTILTIYAREFILAAQIRIYRDKVMDPTSLGKVKTVVQFGMLLIWMFPFPGFLWMVIRGFICTFTLVITVLSWVEYYQEYVSSRWRPVKNYY
jgi:CDP-diacylglycerol--glycerol-3-phosphate 3-phosphatidyltransferase